MDAGINAQPHDRDCGHVDPVPVVVASRSDVSYATARRRGLPQGTVVAPPPEVKAVSLRRGIITPNAGVVGPPPTVNGSIREVGNINIGQSRIVEPSPQLPMHEQH